MWNELESYKNHFLQWQLPHLASERINTMVKKEFEGLTKRDQPKRGPTKRSLAKRDQPSPKAKRDQPTTTKHDQQPIKTTKREPPRAKRDDRCLLPPDFDHCPRHSTYFEDRTKLAYGLLALPKLMRELGSDHRVTNWQAINTLSEILLNPWHAQRAINEMDIVRRTQNLFLRKRRYSKDPQREVRQLIRIFYILSLYLNGAEKMMRHRHLLNELYTIVDNREEHEQMAAKVLRNLSEKPKVLLFLLEQTNAMEHLTRIFHRDACGPFADDLWLHLGHFLELAPERALDAGFFELLHGRVVGRLPLFHRLAMKCFGLLLQCGEGQARFDAVDGVALLHRILTTEDDDGKDKHNARGEGDGDGDDGDGVKEAPPLGRWEFVVLALQNGVVSKRSLWRCCELSDLPAALVRLAREGEATRRRELELAETCAGRRICDEEQEALKHQQLYCLKTLRQISQMPSLKRFIRDACLQDIRSMVCCNEVAECTRDELVLWLEREIFHSEAYGYFHTD